MDRFRSHLRLIGSATAVAAWLLLATHFCVDVGEAHAPVTAVAGHGEADPHGADLADPECAPALSADRDPGSPAMAVDSGLVPVGVATGKPAPHVPILFPADVGRARSAPLYLLHATLLI